MELKGKKIAFLGDSITEGCGTSDIRNAFWNVVAQRTGAVSYGYGVGGSRIAPNRHPDESLPSERWFALRAAEMIPDADVVVVFGGTNDYGHGDAALGTNLDRDGNSFYGAMHLLLQTLITRYPAARLVVMTPLHRLDDTDCTYNEFGVRRVADLEGYVNAIQTVAACYAVPVLDLFRCSGIQPNLPAHRQMFAPDGLHPNDAGHLRIADCLIRFLEML